MLQFISELDYSRIIRAVYTERDDLYAQGVSVAKSISDSTENAVAIAEGCDVFRIESDGVFCGFIIFDPMESLIKLIVFRKNTDQVEAATRELFGNSIKNI